MIEQQVHAAVQNGIKFLNEKYPGWERRFDFQTFNMRDACNCVAGQADKQGFWEVLKKHEISASKSEDCNLGFRVRNDIDSMISEEAEDKEWDYLQEVWKQEILKLRGER